MSRIALHSLDQIGDQIVALLELDIDVTKGLLAPLAQPNKAVVAADEQQGDDDENGQKDPETHGDPLQVSKSKTSRRAASLHLSLCCGIAGSRRAR